jgi:hypothetical protein
MKTISLPIVLLLLLTISCNQQSKKSEKNEMNNSSKENISFQINSLDGKTIGGFDINTLHILSGDKIYQPKEKAEKRKYYYNGNLCYEVKGSEDGFKLKNAESKLLWKIKLYPDKIKIADNEENTNSFEIKNKTGKIEITRNNEKIASVKINDLSLLIDDKETYKISQSNQSFILGVLAINQIPMEHRFFIIAEYLHRNK